VVIAGLPVGFGWGTRNLCEMGKLGTITTMEHNLFGPVADALVSLPIVDQRILAMTYSNGLNATEVAARLGMEPASVRKRHERILVKLAESEALRNLHRGSRDELFGMIEDAATCPVSLQDL